MKAMQLLDNLEFHDGRPYAQPLLVEREGRVLRFMLKPGQNIKEHHAPDTPFYVVVLRGKGMFTGGEKQEQLFGPGSLIVFEPGEYHTVRALDEELVFVGFLHGVPSNALDREGGLLGHEQESGHR